MAMFEDNEQSNSGEENDVQEDEDYIQSNITFPSGVITPDWWFASKNPESFSLINAVEELEQWTEYERW
jgi:hypothetical protein